VSWLLATALIVVGYFTVVEGISAVRDLVYFNVHRDAPIEGGMTIAFVAQSYHVPRSSLQQALGLPATPQDMRPLERIAADRRVSFPVVRATLHLAIAEARNSERDKSEGKPR
jgi:hypothetical protein